MARQLISQDDDDVDDVEKEEDCNYDDDTIDTNHNVEMRDESQSVTHQSTSPKNQMD